MPGFNQKIKQDNRQRDAERRREDSYSLRIQRMFEGVSKQIKAEEQEEQHEKTGETAEGSCQPSANDQRFDVVRGDAGESLCAHSSSLAGALSQRDGILDPQELQVGEAGGNVFFLHVCAANAEWITAVEKAVGLDYDCAVTRGICAMPVFACFHDHGACLSLDFKLAGIAEKAAQAQAHSKRRRTI